MVATLLVHPAKRCAYACVFDVHSGVVSAAFIRKEHSNKCEVLCAQHTHIVFNEDTSAENLAKSIRSAIAKTASKIVEYIAREPALAHAHFDVHVYIHAPWSSSSSRRYEMRLPEPTLITKSVLRTHTRQVDIKEVPIGYTEFFRRITSIELNGYLTTNPYEKRAESIAVTILSSIMATPIHVALSGAIADAFPQQTCHITPFIYDVIRAQYDGEDTKSYALIDIGDVYTSIKAIRGKTIVNTGSLNFGTRDVLEPLMRTSADDRAHALSLLAMYTDNTLTPIKMKEIEHALASTEVAWIKAFGDACAKMSQRAKLPSRAYIIAPKEATAWFEDIVERFDFGQFTVTGKALQAEVISPVALRKAVTVKKGVTLSTTLALAVLFVLDA